MVYIENEGALFRGPAQGLPQEVWSEKQGKFVSYADAGKIKPIEWGYVISEEEAQAMMGAIRKGIPRAGAPARRPPREAAHLQDQLDFGTIPNDLKKDLVAAHSAETGNAEEALVTAALRRRTISPGYSGVGSSLTWHRTRPSLPSANSEPQVQTTPAPSPSACEPQLLQR